jgi:hypothetical protein
MPTLEAMKAWEAAPPPDTAGTDTDWPISVTVLYSDTDGPIDRPTDSQSFSFTPAPYVESDSAHVRRAIRRAVQEFGPAFDRLGDG